jgi:hypothetical protein
MPGLGRVTGAVAGLCAAIVLALAPAQAQAPAELPKGLFPPALPGQSPTPAEAPGQPSAPRGEPANPRSSDGTLAVPPLARVTDIAGVLDAQAKAQLEAKLAAFEQSKGSQIAIIVVPSTQPEPIADFTNRVGDAWKIGRKGV